MQLSVFSVCFVFSAPFALRFQKRNTEVTKGPESTAKNSKVQTKRRLPTCLPTTG